jgi:hypothetical protein
MATDPNAIVVPGTGRVLVAPVGTTGPADVATALNVAYVDSGYTSEDGITITPSIDANDVKVFQSNLPVRRSITGRGLEVHFTMLEWSDVTLPFAFGGGSVTATTGPPAHYLYNAPSSASYDERSLVVEWTDGTNITRFTAPRGAVTDIGDINVVRGEASGFEVTYTVFASGTGTDWYIRSNLAALAVG